jgi:hypothetical protein
MSTPLPRRTEHVNKLRRVELTTKLGHVVREDEVTGTIEGVLDDFEDAVLLCF